MKKIITILLLFVWTGANEAMLSPPLKQKASFLIAYEIIKSYEGGYANIVDDFGEETYCGISRKFSKNWHGWFLIDKYKRTKGTPPWNYYFNDITDWLVTEFYANIWVSEGFLDLDHQAMANYLFDFRIHSLSGVKIIQQQLNECGYQFALDNTMNKEMITALNSVEPEYFLKLLKQKRIEHYKHIADQYPSQRKFLFHWLKRANV